MQLFVLVRLAFWRCAATPRADVAVVRVQGSATKLAPLFLLPAKTSTGRLLSIFEVIETPACTCRIVGLPRCRLEYTPRGQTHASL